VGRWPLRNNAQVILVTLRQKNRRGVLCVSPNLRNDSGGPSVSIVNGVLAENANGTDVVLVTTRSREPEDDRGAIGRLGEANLEFRTFRTAGGSHRSAAWGISPQLIAWMVVNARRFEVIHLRYVWSLTTLLGCFLGRVYRVPVVLTPHESLTSFDIEVTSGSRIKTRIKRILRHFILRSTNHILLASRLETSQTDAGKTPVSLVPHPVPLPDGEMPDRPSPGDSFRIGFLGRHAEKKGIARLISAVGKADEKEWQLIIGGPPDPHHRDAPFRQLADELGLGDRIEWPGLIVKGKDAFLSGLDVLVMPSDFESFGMVAAEAMACRTPVIVPRNSGIADLVSESGGGIVVDQSDPDALLLALRQLAEDQQKRCDAGERGRDAVATQLSPRAYWERTSRIYASLIGKKHD